VGVEVDEPDRTVAPNASLHVGMGNRVIASKHDRDAPGGDDLAYRVGDSPVRSGGVSGQHGRVAEVDDP
jgi:hypothetical protein